MLRELRIVIVDDDDLFRDQLRQVIEHGTTYTVVGEGADGQDAIALATRTLPDAIVIDTQMPRLDGIEATRVIKAAHPRMFVIGLVGSELQIPAMRGAGADSCLMKGQSLAMLFDLLASIAQSAPPAKTAVQPATLEEESPTFQPVAPSLELDAPLLLPQDDALLRLILDGVQDAVAVTEVLSLEAPPRTVYVNRSFGELLGREPDALVGKTLDFWDRIFGDPEERRAVTERLLDGETITMDVPMMSGLKEVQQVSIVMQGIATMSGSYVVCLGHLTPTASP